jgi:hypothetical protein
MKVTFILQLFCIKDPMAYVYLQIGPYTYLRAYFPYDSINLTPNIIFLLSFKATFQSTHHTLKGLYCIKITNTPLALCTTHIKHACFTLEFRVYITYYLNVTAFPPKKNLIPRFGSRIELNDLIWGIRWKESWEILLKIGFCFPSCFFFGMMIP